MKLSLKFSYIFIIISALFLFFSGCSDYRGVDDLNIVSGIAIDFSEKDNSKYTVTLEILDTMTPGGKSDIKSNLYESDGITIFDAIFNTNKQLMKEMYFGNTGILIISEEIAKSEGIAHILDALLRDYYIRNTMSLIISREKTAKELLINKADENEIVSFILNENLNYPKKYTISTQSFQLYKLYDYLQGGKIHLTLPAFSFQASEKQNEKKNGEKTLLSDGLAVFREDKLIGYMDETNLPFYMCLTENLEGGPYVFSIGSSEDKEENPLNDITVQIVSTKSSFDFNYDGEQFIFKINLKAFTHAVEVPVELTDINTVTIEKMQEKAAKTLEKEIINTLKIMQTDLKADIFGFGKTVYQKNPLLWSKVKDNWDTYFENAKFEFDILFDIKDTGMISTFNVNPNDNS